jgi:hypothetical protein
VTKRFTPGGRSNVKALSKADLDLITRQDIESLTGIGPVAPWFSEVKVDTGSAFLIAGTSMSWQKRWYIGTGISPKIKGKKQRKW